ncbi:aerobic C4-dicarboxylate transport protein [Plasticicumulans lactativorans]|uniref:C4-dicarboxylate transport protein n=1 Tax=Plasticicumulans lactativorans TaxID=1133106 RepID=A0A4V2SBY4_9GAMM|nr:aerobic C4-dicarboxylate transport protein [Plasticicumulans lactativorans]
MPKIFKSLYFQVLTAIAIGIVLGHFQPKLGVDLKPLGDTFIKMIKMVIAPIIFCTVVVGIAGMEDMKKVGRVGAKALVYFEIVTTFALAIGLLVVNLVKPGAGVNADVSTIDTSSIASFTAAAQKQQTTAEFFMNIVPGNIVDAFAKGDILQVLFFAILFGFALAAMGEKGRPLVKILDQIAHGMFGVVGIVMKVAPIGAFGAMAFTIGKYGVSTLGNLAVLMGSFYLTCVLFVFLVLGGIAKWTGFSIWSFIKFIKEELLIVLGTSSSESVLPRMMDKLERLGCSKSVVGLVIPTGYSFNLDGTAIYLTMAAIFIAQATGVELSLVQELTILGILMVTSKGAAGVTGSGFVVLAATLASIGTIPVAGLALILGIDRFMSEARALTNLIGNGIATIVVAKWEGELDVERMRKHLDGSVDVEQELEEEVHFPLGQTAPVKNAA